MNLAEVDFGDSGPIGIPEGIKAQYRAIIPEVLAVNPHIPNPQEALSYIRSAERRSDMRLYGTSLVEEATSYQRMTFDRRLFRLKTFLQISSDNERLQLREIDTNFSEAATKLSLLRGVEEAAADNILMRTMTYTKIRGFDHAIEILTKGPIIEGFGSKENSEYDFSNEDLREMLESSFGLEAILRSHVLDVSRVDGFPVQCKDIEFGNECVGVYGARWGGGYLVLPDRVSYEQVEMKLEGKEDLGDLEHSFKLRASTATPGLFALIRVYNFVVEKPSYFDYIDNLPMSDHEKMRAYFLGIVAHELVHALQAYGIDRTIQDKYRGLAQEEHSDALDHKFVTKYVDRHHTIYQSDEVETLGEDLAEAVRLYLTNPEFLRRHFPRRYLFMQEDLSFLKENAIAQFVKLKSKA